MAIVKTVSVSKTSFSSSSFTLLTIGKQAFPSMDYPNGCLAEDATK
jgi:hypothetical protein